MKNLLRWLRKQSILGWHWDTSESRSGLSAGAEGERLAADFLRKLGYKILQRGYRSGLGEIDIVAFDNSDPRGRTLVFIEVKTWSKPSLGGPSDAVDQRKQEKLTRLAMEYLKKHRALDKPARFDVVQVILHPEEIRHFVNAFEPTGKGQWYS